jgi:hypothetical protein
MLIRLTLDLQLVVLDGMASSATRPIWDTFGFVFGPFGSDPKHTFCQFCAPIYLTGAAQWPDAFIFLFEFRRLKT